MGVVVCAACYETIIAILTGLVTLMWLMCDTAVCDGGLRRFSTHKHNVSLLDVALLHLPRSPCCCCCWNIADCHRPLQCIDVRTLYVYTERHVSIVSALPRSCWVTPTLSSSSSSSSTLAVRLTMLCQNQTMSRRRRVRSLEAGNHRKKALQWSQWIISAGGYTTVFFVGWGMLNDYD